MTYKGRAPFQSAAFTETQRNFTYFDKSLTSGLTDVMIESPGDFLYIDQASTGVVQIELNMRQGGTLAPITLAAGGSIECDFSSVKLTAATQLGKTVRIIIGNGARIKGGANVNASSLVVTSVDGAKVRTDENGAFVKYTGKEAVAGQYSYSQIFNPVANTKNIYLERVKVLQGAVATIGIVSYSTLLANGEGYGVSKNIGGAASTAVFRSESSASVLLTDYIGILATTASASDTYTPIEPFKLAPGTGINIFPQSVNTAIYAVYEFFEE